MWAGKTLNPDKKAPETKEHRRIPNKVVRSSDGEASSTQYTKQHGPRHRVSKRKAGLNFCDECVREALGTTRANLTEKDLHTNAVSVGLSRAPGLCSSCGKQRIVTRTA
jgi:hypothetical protein